MTDVRTLRPEELSPAAELIGEAFARSSTRRGFAPPWTSSSTVEELVRLYHEQEAEGCVVAEREGQLVGVGFIRRRGEIASLGPLAVATERQGIGSALLDELITRAEGWSCSAIRLYHDGWNADAFALYAGRSFSVVDVVARLERSGGAPPRLDAARGLEISAVRAQDLPEIAALDLRLTGQERLEDLTSQVRLVARRRGALVGFLGGRGSLLGPAVALDVADLGALIGRALVELEGKASARLSTAAPTAMMAALGLGFQVVETGLVLSRGISPPARPPQLYSIVPEIL